MVALALFSGKISYVESVRLLALLSLIVVMALGAVFTIPSTTNKLFVTTVLSTG